LHENKAMATRYPRDRLRRGCAARRAEQVAGVAAGQLQFFGVHAHLANAKAFAAFLAPLRKKRWFVCSKRPFARPNAVPAYFSRHTHRVAISSW
jgi:hypothetical protein